MPTRHPEFPIQNLPFGIFSLHDGVRAAGRRDRRSDLDLRQIAALLPSSVGEALDAAVLNTLLELAPSRAPRAAPPPVLPARTSIIATEVRPALHPAAGCTVHLPAAIGDYTDFYVGIHHATNVGTLFRPDNPLLPNYKHVPIGYHGRASSVRPPACRSSGRRASKSAADATEPSFGPSKRLDYELELGVWIGRRNALGTSIPIGEAAGHIAGFSLLNDWSARDLQAWEYQPLGPFLAKNFHTTISPWVVTTEALAPFRIAQPARPDGDPRPLPYLWDEAETRRRAGSPP